MKIRPHKRRIVLVLMAFLLPIIVLVGLTMRMVRQERELTQKRVADEHRTRAREVGQALLSRLEKLVRQEAAILLDEPQTIGRRGYANPEVVLIAKVKDTRLILPWEVSLEGNDAALRNENEYGRILRQAENAEFSQKNHSLAAERYGRAALVARSPIQEGYARLQRSRALMKTGKEKESLLEYEEILSLPSDVLDEYGVPLSLYAAGPLMAAGQRYRKVVERIGSQLRSEIWLPPAGIYFMKDILEEVIVDAPEQDRTALRGSAEDNLRNILARIQTMEQALSLKEDFPRLGLESFPGTNVNKNAPLWVSYGQHPWLVGLSPPVPEGGSLLVAVDFRIFSSALTLDTKFLEDSQLVTGLSAGGVSLGPDFQGLQVVFGTRAEEAYSKQWSLQRLFYFLALVVVLGMTLFGAYLLWRDVRREILLAEMRSQFVSSVSHELKTPLTAIRMFAETLRLGRSNNPKTQTEYLDTIVNESERLTRLLNNVLDFSKIEQGKRIYQLAPASLPEIVTAAIRAMEYPLKQQDFKLDVELDKRLPEVNLDRDAIEQAVLNLLSNAMKYSGDSRWIGLKVRREDDWAVIQVIDRGVGIDPKEQARIFNKFYRIPTRENQSLPGTGLGLSLVAHIAKAHGGSVRVESAPGEGSTFSILLPLEQRS